MATEMVGLSPERDRDQSRRSGPDGGAAVTPVERVIPAARMFGERAAHYDQEATFPVVNYEELKSTGLINLAVPPEFGGDGIGLLDMVAVLDQMARGCASTALAFTMHLSTTGQIAHMWRLDDDPKWEAWLDRIGAGKLALGGSLSEPNSWNGVIFPQTLAARVERGYRVSGTRSFCTGSVVLDLLQCTAQYTRESGEKRGIYFLVPPDSPGIDFRDDWDTMGMRASASRSIRVLDLFVPDDAILYDYPYATLDVSPIWTSFLTWSFLGFASIYLGIAARARDFAVEAITNRVRAPGTHPLSHRAISQHHVGEMDVLNAAMRAFCDEVARRYSGPGPMPLEAVLDSGKAKQFVVTHAIRVVDLAISVVGGQSYYRKFPLERMWRDVRAGPFHPFSADDSLEMLGKMALGVPLLEPSGWAL